VARSSQNAQVRWRWGVLAAAAIAAIVPLPAGLVDRVYTFGLFPRLQHALTTVSNLTPVALFDLLVGATAVAWTWRLWRDWRSTGNRWRVVRPLITRTATMLALAYLVFLVCWGWNYQRRPLTATLAFDRTRVSKDGAERLATRTIDRLNALYETAHREGWAAQDGIDPRLVSAFWRAQDAVGNRTHIVPGRPKRTLFDLYFRRAGVAGMTDPYFLETFIATDLLPFERAHVIAHEWAHLAGFNDEGDANFVGFLATQEGTAAHQYSGWLFLYAEVSAAVDRAAFRAIGSRLAPGPRGDLLAIRDRLTRNVNRRLSAAGWQVYDQYLKANRVEEGTRSYGQVVTLILGTGRY
jgi:hypothetical protein